MLPNLFLVYYGFVAFHTEPLQVCADMLRQGFDVGMSLGETGIAFFNSIQHVRAALMAGDKLPSLLEKVNYYLTLTNAYQNDIAKVFHFVQQETISILIDNGGASCLTPHAVDEPTGTTNEILLGMIYFHRAIQAYWQGHNERCRHYIKKVSLSATPDFWRLLFITFIDGMNSCQLLKRTSNGKLRSLPRNESSSQLRSIPGKAIEKLKAAASHSSSNFGNKVRYNQTLFICSCFLYKS